MSRNVIALAVAFALTGCTSQAPRTQDINPQSALRAALPYPVLDWKVLTTSADRERASMSTLFGDDMAVLAARKNQPYPVGSKIALTTWQQRNNPNWFGSRVPGDAQRIELIEFTAAGPTYRAFARPGFQEQSGADAAERIALITSMKAVALP